MSDIYRTAAVPTLGESYEIGRAHGARAEQERIIKLLEASAIAWSDDCAVPVDWEHCQNCWEIASLITRIKGENT